MRVSAIITAAGEGKRFGEELPKQFTLLNGKPVLYYSVDVLSRSHLVSEIVLVVHEDWVSFTREKVVEKFGFEKVKKIVEGGRERQDSVKNGLDAVSAESQVVAVHDGVRPFTSPGLINSVINEASWSGAAIAALPLNDTIKRASPHQYIEHTVPRESLWFAQTPQAFKCDILRQAYAKAAEDGFLGTDESFLVERIGVKVKLIPGSLYNIKITTPEDLQFGELILKNGLLGK
jgi:2-C-methyl-D-erythritol 4-phosphate cytidylyltransferase